MPPKMQSLALVLLFIHITCSQWIVGGISNNTSIWIRCNFGESMPQNRTNVTVVCNTTTWTTGWVTTRSVTTQTMTTSFSSPQSTTSNTQSSTGRVTSGNLPLISTSLISTGAVEVSTTTNELGQSSTSKEDKNNLEIAIIILVIILVLGIAISATIILYRMVYKRKGARVKSVELPIYTEYPANALLTGVQIGELLGSGNFGEVFKGTFQKKPVAVKRLKNAEGIVELQKEIAILSQLGSHPCVVQFLGTYVSDSNETFIVMEYVPDGNLLDLLRQGYQTLSLTDQIHMIVTACSGLSFLESKSIVHRDISARNFLVAKQEGKYIAKVSDFGLARVVENYYRPTSTTLIPVRWCAPEALRTMKFTIASDVWSFGVVMWEILEFGKQPYSWLSNKEVTERVPLGESLSRPPNCPDKLWEIISLCFRMEADQRPSFNELLKLLEAFQANFQETNDYVTVEN